MSAAEETLDKTMTPSVESGLAGAAEALSQAPPASPAAEPPMPHESGHPFDGPDDFESGWQKLPPYSRSLLKIDVPISVTLASKKQRLSDILRLVPGSIIQFNKSCEDVLELNAAHQTIAVGEAVKVDDCFGLRITSMSLPGERFQPVRKANG